MPQAPGGRLLGLHLLLIAAEPPQVGRVYIRKAFGVELDADEFTAQLGEHRALKRTGAPVVFTVPFPPRPPSLAPLTLPWQAESTVLMIPGKKRKAEEPKEKGR